MPPSGASLHSAPGRPGLSEEHYKELVAKAPADEEMESMNKGDAQGAGRDEHKAVSGKQTGHAGPDVHPRADSAI